MQGNIQLYLWVYIRKNQPKTSAKRTFKSTEINQYFGHIWILRFPREQFGTTVHKFYEWEIIETLQWVYFQKVNVTPHLRRTPRTN